MRTYLHLFSVDVEHTFFSRSLCPGLNFVPTSNTRAILENAGLLMRSTATGIRVFYGQDNTDTLRLYVSSPEEPLSLGFKVYAQDRRFKNYAAHREPEEDSILYFDNQDTKRDASGRFRLHKADYVSEADFERVNSPRIEDILSSRDRLVKPEFILTIRLEEKDVEHLEEPSKAAAKNYYLKFKARETIWKYYFIGNLTKKNLDIVDLNNETQFEDTGPESLPDDRTALTFRSKQELFLREKSEYRFQLKEKDPNGGKVLIKRLPVASANQFLKESINGKEAILSEIFINC